MKAFAAILLLTPIIVFADGIPFDREARRVTVPHETFALTESQRLELFRQHHVTLTTSQRERLAERFPNFPQTIETVIPYDWSDCTCFSGHPYAILLPGCTSIALTDGEADIGSRFGTQPGQLPPVVTAPAKPQSGWNRFWSRFGGHSSR